MSHEIKSAIPANGPLLPPDPILGISRLVHRDPNPDRVDAGVGVFKTENGKTWVPAAARIAGLLVAVGPTEYLSPSGKSEWLGDPLFLEETAKSVFGGYAPDLIENGKLVAVGTAGGTGALSSFADALYGRQPDTYVLLSHPTWGNHIKIFLDRDFNILKYSHLREDGVRDYNFEAHLQAIKTSPENTLVVFQTGRTHNPTGANPQTPEEWKKLAGAMEGRKALFDTAYAGFDGGVDKDTEAIRIFLDRDVSLAVAYSYSKSAGMYRHRVGALMLPCPDRDTALNVQRYVNEIARGQISTPPGYGETTVAKMMTNGVLRTMWKRGLAQASRTLTQRRQLLAGALGEEYGYIAEDQHGLYSLLGLTPQETYNLRKESVYVTQDGRINIGGVSKKRITKIAEAVHRVKRGK